MPSPSGDLYVSDGYRNARVHSFSGDGRLISSLGEPGKEGPNQCHLPHSLLVDEDGTVFLCDRANNRIQVFSADGQFREMWSDLRRPLDISMDSDGVLCVTEGGVNGLSARSACWTSAATSWPAGSTSGRDSPLDGWFHVGCGQVSDLPFIHRYAEAFSATAGATPHSRRLEPWR